MDDTHEAADAELDHKEQSVVTNNPFLGESQSELSVDGDTLQISEMQISAAYQSNKSVAEEGEEHVEPGNSGNEGVMKSETNGLSDAAKAAIVNATNFDVLNSGEDSTNLSINGETENYGESLDQKKNKKSKKKKKKKAKKEKKGLKKEKRKRKNKDTASSDSDFDDGNL